VFKTFLVLTHSHTQKNQQQTSVYLPACVPSYLDHICRRS